ncbi:MAG: hypothetical protein GY807_09320 [Gammaproteobacteria bacterium]|nr:hypothetical protein [Gammaproteobacteria bacterium]
MKQLFRGLVVATTLAYVLWFCLPFISVHIFDSETLDALSWVGYGAIVNLGDLAPYIFLIAYGIIAIGLIYFHRWARTGFAILAVVTFILAPLSGLNVQTAIDSTLSYFFTLADGAILAIAFLTSISDEFNQPYNEQG